MISHVHLGAADLDRACAFYDPIMAALGFPPRFRDPEAGWAGWSARDGGRPFLLIGRPFDGERAAPGNGQMVALEARSRAEVDRAHALALAHGGADEGAPGLRPRYHAHYYGAYVCDPDGNKLCFVCHAPGEGE